MSIAASNTGFEIRPARREDLGAIHAMIRELAAYEKLLHLCVSTEPELDAGAVRAASRPPKC